MMGKRWICITLLVIAALSLVQGYPSPARAGKTGYVSDMLILTMRKGPGRDYDVIRTLRSNMPLEILSEENGFSRVISPGGEEGWVENQYITFETPPTLIIEQLEKKIQALERTVDTLREEPEATDENDAVKREKELEGIVAELEADLKRTKAEKEAIAAERNRIQKDYADLLDKSKNVVEISNENDHLRQMNESLTVDLQFARDNRSELFKIGMLRWFIAGASVLFAGWIIGRIFSGGKKRSGGLLD